MNLPFIVIPRRGDQCLGRQRGLERQVDHRGRQRAQQQPEQQHSHHAPSTGAALPWPRTLLKMLPKTPAACTAQSLGPQGRVAVTLMAQTMVLRMLFRATSSGRPRRQHAAAARQLTAAVNSLSWIKVALAAVWYGPVLWLLGRSQGKAVLEDGDECTLQFEDGSSVTVKLANPGASVAVRDRSNAVEYLG